MTNEIWTPLADGEYGGIEVKGEVLSMWYYDNKVKEYLPDDSRLCRLTPPAQEGAGAVEVQPDSPGWWAFEGRWHSAPESSTWKHVLEAEIKDGILYVGFGGDYELPSMLVGKWWKLTMPWERQRPSAAQATPQADTLIVDPPDQFGVIRVWPYGREPHLLSISVITKFYERDGTISGVKINWSGYPVSVEDTRQLALALLKACEIASAAQANARGGVDDA